MLLDIEGINKELQRLQREVSESVEAVAQLAKLEFQHISDSIRISSEVIIPAWMEMFLIYRTNVKCKGTTTYPGEKSYILQGDDGGVPRRFHLKELDYSEVHCTPQMVLDFFKQANSVEQAARESLDTRRKIASLERKIRRLSQEDEKRLRFAYRVQDLSF